MLEGVNTYYPAWDQTYSAEMMKHKINEAVKLVDLLKKTVTDLDNDTDLPVLVEQVCGRLGMPMLKANPLFNTTVQCLRQEKK
jgi:hypothetical protein